MCGLPIPHCRSMAGLRAGLELLGVGVEVEPPAPQFNHRRSLKFCF